MGDGMDRGVYALVRDRQGYVYAGGNFEVVRNGTQQLAVNRIARWNASTGMWSPVGNGFQGWVETLAVDSQAQIYAGGAFNGAYNNGLNNIARWDRTTNQWLAVSSGTDGPVYALTVDRHNQVYAGGAFTT